MLQDLRDGKVPPVSHLSDDVVDKVIDSALFKATEAGAVVVLVGDKADLRLFVRNVLSLGQDTDLL